MVSKGQEPMFQYWYFLSPRSAYGTCICTANTSTLYAYRIIISWTHQDRSSPASEGGISPSVINTSVAPRISNSSVGEREKNYCLTFFDNSLRWEALMVFFSLINTHFYPPCGVDGLLSLRWKFISTNMRHVQTTVKSNLEHLLKFSLHRQHFILSDFFKYMYASLVHYTDGWKT